MQIGQIRNKRTGSYLPDLFVNAVNNHIAICSWEVVRMEGLAELGGRAIQVHRVGEFFIGAPGRIRTSDLRIRSPALYPAELRARIKNI